MNNNQTLGDQKLFDVDIHNSKRNKKLWKMNV